MLRRDKERLIAAASDARERAVAPYSQFRVGAALLSTDGRIITGANVESASFGLTCCAERVALFKALTDGVRHFAAIAVVADCPGGAAPCGACRQLLIEYASDAIVFVADRADLRKVRRFRVRDLLPSPFKDFRKNSV